MTVKPTFGGPCSYVIGEEEKKEVMDVLESGYLFRYGSEDDPSFKKKVFTLEQEFSQLIGVKCSKRACIHKVNFQFIPYLYEIVKLSNINPFV